MALIKTPDEIAKIRQACKATDAIFSKIIQNFNFKTEVELRDFILAEIQKRGLKPSFPPIVTCGSRAGGSIHPESSSAKLKGFVIIDFGVVYERYMSDMTRTIYIGTPSAKEKKDYYTLLLCQEACIKAVQSGVTCASVDAYARELLGPLKKYFIHTLGHGVGTKIHENPKIYEKLTKPKFKEGMIITIEPGIYIKNKYGIRIEDTLLVGAQKCTSLTKSSKELIIV